VLFAVTVVYPILQAVQMSLYDWRIIGSATSEFLGLENYARALGDEHFWLSFGNTVFYLVATIPPQIVIGLSIALLLHARSPIRPLLRVLYYLPVVTSWVVVSLLFQYLFSTDRGFVNWVLRDFLHVVDHNVNWLGDRWPAMVAISLLGIWKGVGWSMLIFLAALTGVPRELYEAASIDGAGAARRFRHVSLPLISGAVATVVILLVIGGFNVFTSVLLMIGNDPLQQKQVPLTYMYDQAFSFLDFGYGSAISFLLTTVVLALAGLQYVVTQRRVRGTFR